MHSWIKHYINEFPGIIDIDKKQANFEYEHFFFNGNIQLVVVKVSSNNNIVNSHSQGYILISGAWGK